jgi:hypothetical protein
MYIQLYDELFLAHLVQFVVHSSFRHSSLCVRATERVVKINQEEMTNKRDQKLVDKQSTSFLSPGPSCVQWRLTGYTVSVSCALLQRRWCKDCSWEEVVQCGDEAVLGWTVGLIYWQGQRSDRLWSPHSAKWIDWRLVGLKCLLRQQSGWGVKLVSDLYPYSSMHQWMHAVYIIP